MNLSSLNQMIDNPPDILSTQKTITKISNTLRVLHTSDWHIGKKFGDIHRYDEYQEFLAWIIHTIHIQKVDILIVAGDIFDTVAPSNKSQNLYYEFLNNIQKSSCRHIIITAGNHDSPTFLEAPKNLLKNLNIYVIGTPSDTITDEIITLYDNQQPVCIVCAVPYLRDSDVRHKYTKTQFGDTLDTLQKNTVTAIKQYYHEILAHAKQLKHNIANQYHINVPIIATGHFFATGADISSSDDGMRDTVYVGHLNAVDVSDIQHFDYMALGHIHKPQIVAKNPYIRYCGSPMVMGFGEANAKKYILIVDFNQKTNIHFIQVPRFRAIIQLTGDYAYLKTKIKQLNHNIDEHYDKDNKLIKPKQAILSISYTGEYLPNISEKIKSLLADNISLIQLKIDSPIHNTTNHYQIDDVKNIDQTKIIEYILSKKISDDNQKQKIKALYDNLVNQMHEKDNHAF